MNSSDLSPKAVCEGNRYVVPYTRLLELITSALVTHGFSATVAAPIARTIAESERDGTASHGLLRLPGFVEAVRSGWADGQALPKVLSKSASMIVVDARNGFTHLALDLFRAEIGSMADETGVAILLVRHGHHFAALWPDIEGFAREGKVAMTCVNSRARMAAWGGGKPVLGTNASAFACPRGQGDPIVWDQSTSVMSQGDVLLAAREGRPLPAGVGVDSTGQASTDPNAVLNGGALLPYGAQKGASIAFMVEILAAALSGSDFGFEAPDKGTLPSKCGQFLMVIDPKSAGVDVGRRVESLVHAISEAGCDRLPASRRYAHREQVARDGIVLSNEAHALLQKSQNT